MMLWSILATCLPVALGAVTAHRPWLLDRDAPKVNQVMAAKASDESYWRAQAAAQGKKLCYVSPNSAGGDDAPSIVNAFNNDCRENSLVVFPGPTYHINTPMTTNNLSNVEVHHFGHFLWSTDINYWLSVSMPMNFQNQSTVWYFGGDRVNWTGHGVGTLDGNGQVWYDWAKNQGNLAHRPCMINWRRLTNSIVSGMRFVQSQMWTMTVTYSSNLEFDDIYVNNTSTSQYNTLNTDGVDTIYSNNITFRRWSVTNGDDAFALKRNSTNISVYDSEIWGGQGLAIGSMGQYNNEYEVIENFYARNITMHKTAHAIYLKTWGGVSRGVPPNGGGGGLGLASNITIEDITLDGNRQQPFFIWQCENYSGYSGQDCDSSKFKMQNVRARNVHGTSGPGVTQAAYIQCSSSAAGCNNITLDNFNIKSTVNGALLVKYYCSNVHDFYGFSCGTIQ